MLAKLAVAAVLAVLALICYIIVAGAVVDKAAQNKEKKQ